MMTIFSVLKQMRQTSRPVFVHVTRSEPSEAFRSLTNPKQTNLQSRAAQASCFLPVSLHSSKHSSSSQRALHRQAEPRQKAQRQQQKHLHPQRQKMNQIKATLTLDASQFLMELDRVKSLVAETLQMMIQLEQMSNPHPSQREQRSIRKTTQDNRTQTLKRNSQRSTSSLRLVQQEAAGDRSSSSTSDTSTPKD